MPQFLLPLIFSFFITVPAFAADMTVYKDPNCGCCGKWVKHMEAAGHNVTTVNTKDMDNTKAAPDGPARLSLTRATSATRSSPQ
jgi:hypothetical protein